MIALLAFVLFWMQFQVLHRLGGIPPTDRFATPSLFWQVAGKTLAITTGELLLLACIPGIIVSLVLIEVLSKHFTSFLNAEPFLWLTSFCSRLGLWCFIVNAITSEKWSHPYEHTPH